jgi:hypothetical protein
MWNKPVALSLVVGTILCVVVLIGGLRCDLVPASAVRSTMVRTAQPRCSINADCGGRAICVDDLCLRSVNECLADADCGSRGICTYDGMCYLR